MLARFLIVVLTLAAASPVVAQDASARLASLPGLARVFGELHHIRRLCEPEREADVWRDRMKRLIDLEQPSYELREQMVGAFNDGYSTAVERFPVCDADAEGYAASRASTGAAIVASLAAPLYAAASARDDDSGVNITRGGDQQ